MQSIPQWKVQSTSPRGETQVRFEDGTILTWIHLPPDNTLAVQGSGDFYQSVLQFIKNYEGQFRGTLAQFSDTLTNAFPPRPLPEPVHHYDFITERDEKDHLDYFFTRDIIVSYWEQTGKIVFLSEDNVKNPLRYAFDTAFPRGSSVLTREEMRSVMEGICEPLPFASTTTSAEQQVNARPVRIDAPYRGWYPYKDVRVAAHDKEKCQEDVMDEWWIALKESEESSQSHHLLVHAPTGLGKTAATLAPALTWQQQKPLSRQIYYLVATVNQHDNPIETLQQVHHVRNDQGLKTSLKVVDLVGQGQLLNTRNETFCKAPHARQISPICKKSRQTASWSTLPEKPASWRDIAGVLENQDYCPYHFLQGLMSKADVVICDYWWVFSPDAVKAWSWTSLFGSRDIALIVDEAHNLIPRVRNTYDIAVSYSQLSARLAATPNHAARVALSPLLNIVFSDDPLALKAHIHGLAPAELLPLMDTASLADALAYWERQRTAVESQDERVTEEEHIIRNLLAPDEDDIIIYTVLEADDEKEQRHSEPVLIMRRVNATRDLSRGYNMVKASITVSGTLVAPGDPEHELEKLVSQFCLPPTTSKRTKVLKAGTPFSLANQLWVYDSQPAGFYRSRKAWFPYYRNTIVEVGKATPEGVTAVFFSSYDFMHAIYDHMPLEEQDLIIKETKADGVENGQNSGGVKSLVDYEDQLRQKMNNSQEKRSYLFALYGGKIAQGANFEGNLIKTVICVSVPVEMVELFHQRLCQYLWPQLYPGEPLPNAPLGIADPTSKLAWQDAWQYAYERPGMYQVLQAVGRGIRSQHDRCAFVLLDRRYHEFKWHNFLVPAPFHTDTPHAHVQVFHEGAPRRFLDVTNKWEVKLFSIQSL